ncbi:lipocalin-like domain-containing protein [Cupriavidus sp. RAF12]|uniref:lipocalin-like domain-containing protein n=1 Tax=Cupriavidus sp. RAF12 TaxID=3233050 RepID=UPI003F8E291B
MKRRSFLLLLSGFGVAGAASGAAPAYPPVDAGRTLAFPGDHGAHPDYRTEWWYATGWLKTQAGAPLGFQVTFFRSRPQFDQTNPSRFAPQQLLSANVALSDPVAGKLQHDQRAVRSGFGLALADTADTDVYIDDWSLRREMTGRYRARIPARDFTLDLTMEPTQPLLLQGERGYSRKGPLAPQASYYYSQPGLKVSGTLKRGSQQEAVRGTAWLDHEWSSALLAEEAVGWDWLGLNLDDGGALMAFQIRDKAGRNFWGGGTLRGGDGHVRVLAPEEVNFMPVRRWRSPRTGTSYPVVMRLSAGEFTLELIPLMDDQELDSRASTGAVYWEGAVTALRGGKTVGRGYLELTGYFQRLNL